MRTHTRYKQSGFTLIEMLLVMVIISMLVYLSVGYMQQKTFSEQIDRTVLQMQQILNAGLSYYVANGVWPESNPGVELDINEKLQAQGYLPQTTIASPWSAPVTYYTIGSVSPTPGALNGNVFFVYADIGSSKTAYAAAQAIAGKLPMAMACNNYDQNNNSCVTPCQDENECYVVAAVNIPGQNLNNATSVNYAGLYHSGACVQAPNCPLASMTPQVMVVPVAVAGVNDAPTGSPCTPADTSGCNPNTYPINSFTGYAMGPVSASVGSNPKPFDCETQATPTACLSDASGTLLTNTGLASAKYWRVCLGVATEKGPVTPNTPGGPNTNPQGQIMGTVMVLTRCVPSGENMGSGFNVYQ